MPEETKLTYGYMVRRVRDTGPMPEPDERTRLLMLVELDALQRKTAAETLGAPITIERARDAARAALTDAQRAILAGEAERVERLLPPAEGDVGA